MYLRKTPMDAKLASVAKIVREKHPEIIPPPYGYREDGSPRTRVMAVFGDGVVPSMHEKLERHLNETRGPE